MAFKRSYQAAEFKYPAQAMAARKRRKLRGGGYRTGARPQAIIVPGYTRTSGSYGRYAGPHAELKFDDTTLSHNIDSTAEVTTQLLSIAQGVTEIQRIGRKCTIKSIQVKALLTFAPTAAATAAGNTWIYIILDKQTNGAAAAPTDIFTTTNVNTAMINMDNSSRFVVLKKWVHNWGSQAGVTAAYNNQVKTINWYKKCNYDIEWSGTTGAITELRSNNIFMYCGSSPLIDDLVSVSGVCRVRFSDV